MAFQLEKAEKNMRRTTKTAATYREELSKLNSKSTVKEQSLTQLAAEKDLKIQELEHTLKQMKNDLEREKQQQQQRQRLLDEENQKKKSKVCVIS
jgi:hypothetical protein